MKAFVIVSVLTLLFLLDVDVVVSFQHRHRRRSPASFTAQRPVTVPIAGSLSASSSSTEEATAEVSGDVDAQIDEVLRILYTAAETRAEDSDTVVAALLDLEKLVRARNKGDPSCADATLAALGGNGGGSWRLIFTTGTVNTQKRTGRINYFPIRATQSFRVAAAADNDNDNGGAPWLIENGIYVGDFPAVKFRGDFDWTVQKSGVTKLTFDFTQLKLLNFLDVKLKAGEAASLGAKTGLGSESNVNLVDKQGKRPFFNWISADDKIATARGGGGGLALWKRVDYEGGQE